MRVSEFAETPSRRRKRAREGRERAGEERKTRRECSQRRESGSSHRPGSSGCGHDLSYDLALRSRLGGYVIERMCVFSPGRALCSSHVSSAAYRTSYSVYCRRNSVHATRQAGSRGVVLAVVAVW